MPLLSTRGAASANGFGFTSGGAKKVDVDYLVIAGGGSGGYSFWMGTNGGGGGGGGYRTSFPGGTKLSIFGGSTPITVGGGGAGSGPSPGVRTPGNPSIFSTITSTGGGSGAQHQPQEIMEEVQVEEEVQQVEVEQEIVRQ
jgi:hypothetical protein